MIVWEVFCCCFIWFFGECCWFLQSLKIVIFLLLKGSLIVFIFMKSILVVVVVSLVVGNVMVVDGIINFKGEIIVVVCSIIGGVGIIVGGVVGNQIIDVNFGKISIDLLGGIVGGSIVGGISLNLNLDCGKIGIGLIIVKLKFNLMFGSIIDLNNESLLKIVGIVIGVGIGIYGFDGKLLNLLVNEIIDVFLDFKV